MNIISISDFKGRVRLPQKANAEMVTIYNDLILRYQEKVLIDIFGYAFYSEMKTAYDNSELEENPISLDPIWSKLVNGAEITIDSKLRKYNGLKEILTRYVFCWFIIENHISVNTNSVSVPMAEDGLSHNSEVYKSVIWNEMVKLFHCSDVTVYNYIDETNVYPEYEKTTLETESWL